MYCQEDQYVDNELCLACPGGMTNEVGDYVEEGDTTCDITYCDTDYSVVGHVCTSCPAGNSPFDSIFVALFCMFFYLCDCFCDLLLS